ncbi:MAG: hypothetical protein HQ592_07720 [Planctomycetes bacterium]|nr:hypothetical protein [Planctomycetota bacterium]
MHVRAAMFFLAGLIPAVAGCGSLSKSLPARTAREQRLISTAADRALARTNLKFLDDKKVFVDRSYLEAYDAPYVVGKLRNIVAFYGGRLVETEQNSEVTIEVRSGGLSLNESSFLFGIPAMPLFFLGTGLETPELALFKILKQRGVAKLSFFGYETRSRKLLFSTGVRFGSSKATSYWVLFLGPLTFDNLPKLPLEHSGYVFSLEERPPPPPKE